MDPPPRPQGGQGGAPRAAGRPGNGGPRSAGGHAPRAGGFTPRPAQPREPATFEDKLKQFMQSSDSKLSELHYTEKRSGSRRGNGRR